MSTLESPENVDHRCKKEARNNDWDVFKAGDMVMVKVIHTVGVVVKTCWSESCYTQEVFVCFEDDESFNVRKFHAPSLKSYRGDNESS